MPRNITCIFAVASLSLALLMSLASAVTIHVPGDQPTIQAGIDGTVGGDTVLVADGTYSGSGNRNINYMGRVITVMSENGPAVTVINCSSGTRGFVFDSGEQESSVLRGFTITNAYHYREGGAIYLRFSSPTITNCAIVGNVASDFGGGMYCFHADPAIINCTFSRNTANYGGGIRLYYSAPTIANCILWGDTNEEIKTNASSEPTVIYSDVEGGWAGEGNIDEAPLFINPSLGNFGLQDGSPCIDAGDPYSRLDLDGSCNDMGGYGGSGSFPEGVIGGRMSGVLKADESPYIVSEVISELLTSGILS